MIKMNLDLFKFIITLVIIKVKLLFVALQKKLMKVYIMVISQ